jgi:hypothetical protein
MGRTSDASQQSRFGAWLSHNDLDDLGKNDRAALIEIGRHPDLARTVLKETNRSSPQHIWSDLIQPKLSSSAEEDASTTMTSVKTAENRVIAMKPGNAAPENGSNPTSTTQPERAKAPVSSKSAFRGSADFNRKRE